MKSVKRVLLCMIMILVTVTVCGVEATAKAVVQESADVTGSLSELSEELEIVSELSMRKISSDKKAKVKWNDNFTKKDLKYMSAIIFSEANGLSFDAKVAVANVILNRMRNNVLWPHATTVKDVIYDTKWGVQFSPIKGKPSSMDKSLDLYTNLESLDRTNWRYDTMKECIRAAKAAFCNVKVVPDSYVYFNAYVEASQKKCESNNKSYKIIGAHIYFE